MAKTPGWAFSRGCIKEFNAYLKKRKDDLPPGGGEEAGLPWQKPGGEDDEEQDGPSELGEEDLKEKPERPPGISGGSASFWVYVEARGREGHLWHVLPSRCSHSFKRSFGRSKEEQSGKMPRSLLKERWMKMLLVLT